VLTQSCPRRAAGKARDKNSAPAKVRRKGTVYREDFIDVLGSAIIEMLAGLSTDASQCDIF
jgi:hypothetical protein